jgi:hypothetical protein
MLDPHWPPRRKERRVKPRVAVHEAGHVVAAYTFGLPLSNEVVASVEMQGSSRGRTMLYHTPDKVLPHVPPELRRDFALRWLVTAWMGVMAEQQISSYDGFVSGADAKIARTAYGILASNPSDREERNFYARFSYRLADEFTRVFWPEIVAVANHLIEHGTITMDDLRRLIEPELWKDAGKFAEGRIMERRAETPLGGGCRTGS